MFDPNPWGGYPNYNQPQQLRKVNSLDELAGIRLGRNDTAAFFSASDDIFFIKAADEYGQPLPDRAFRFYEIPIDELRPVTITRKEFDELKEMLNNAKLIIQQQTNQSTQNTGKDAADEQSAAIACKQKPRGGSHGTGPAEP